jgi:hypothetical protein
VGDQLDESTIGLDAMAEVASVTFVFNGSEKEFGRLYDAIAPMELDIAAYSKGTTGVIEFMIDDFGTFKSLVARKSSELGMDLVALNYLISEK